MKQIPMIDSDTTAVIKQAMGYRDGHAVCRNCRHFQDDDGSWVLNGKNNSGTGGPAACRADFVARMTAGMRGKA